MREYIYQIILGNSYLFLYLIGIEFFLDKKSKFLNKKEISLFLITPIFYKILNNNIEISFLVYFLLFLILSVIIKYKINFLTLPVLITPFLLIENNDFINLSILLILHISFYYFIKEIIKEVKPFERNSLIIFAIISIIIGYLKNIV
ncbi:MAG: hypothetical protein PWP46_387 [Fusobacteriaceae bacterium]|jgi:hypothetical protein|nr:hypothetical protein [Fusobacteriales bacterium]MDN5303508.1 hypothetical protein [Fusobacteriaceae bacterium]